MRIAIAVSLAAPLILGVSTPLMAKGKTSKIEWYRLNVRAIFRGEEGKWFRAWSAWQRIARPLIEKAADSPKAITPV